MGRRDCGECKACDDLRCEWLRGRGGEEDRPDLCGILVDRLWSGRPLVGAIVGHSLGEGKAMSQEGQSAACNISRTCQMPIVVEEAGDIVFVAGRGEL